MGRRKKAGQTKSTLSVTQLPSDWISAAAAAADSPISREFQLTKRADWEGELLLFQIEININS